MACWAKFAVNALLDYHAEKELVSEGKAATLSSDTGR
jgi:hypothetical protein